MATSAVSRDVARALCLGLCLSIIGVGDAYAKSKLKRMKHIAAIETTAAPPMSQPPQVRFFTINQVLAKKDALLHGTTGIHLAAVDNSKSVNTDLGGNPSWQRSDASDQPFGLFTFRAPEGPLWTKWRGVTTAIAAEKITLNKCQTAPNECGAPAARQFLSIIADAQKHTGQERIALVNQRINQAIRYESDLAQYGVADLWSPPLESLTTGRGDCEDYAIAKYVALQEAGIPNHDLRLLLVRDRTVDEDHAVLAVRNDDQWLILDNRFSQLHVATELPQFTPLFALNGEGVKLFAAPFVMRNVINQEVEITPAAAQPVAVTLSSRGAMLPLLL